MIHRLTTHQERETAKDAWRAIFRTADPFTWPFRKKIECGRVLFPTDGCHLSSLQYEALITAIAGNHETDFLIAIVESESDSLEQDDLVVWRCESPNYHEYSGLDITLENSIFSPTGQWGLIISHEMHGVLGATSMFVSAFDASAGTGVKDRRDFELQWRSAEHQTWLAGLLAHTQ